MNEENQPKGAGLKDAGFKPKSPTLQGRGE